MNLYMQMGAEQTLAVMRQYGQVGQLIVAHLEVPKRQVIMLVLGVCFPFVCNFLASSQPPEMCVNICDNYWIPVCKKP